MNEDIVKALEVLQNGGVILYPTDTIWGLGCDATNESAVKRIFEIKKRLDTKSMLVLLDSSAKLQAYVKEIPEIAWDLIEVADKPLTIIYPSAKNLATSLISEDGSVGIRISSEKFSQTLCARFKRPIVSTSANISGEPSPVNFQEVSKELINQVDYVVSYRQGELTAAVPSSIIKLSVGNGIEIIRA